MAQKFGVAVEVESDLESNEENKAFHIASNLNVLIKK
jgi:hypothetical protein